MTVTKNFSHLTNGTRSDSERDRRCAQIDLGGANFEQRYTTDEALGVASSTRYQRKVWHGTDIQRFLQVESDKVTGCHAGYFRLVVDTENAFASVPDDLDRVPHVELQWQLRPQHQRAAAEFEAKFDKTIVKTERDEVACNWLLAVVENEAVWLFWFNGQLHFEL